MENLFNFDKKTIAVYLISIFSIILFLAAKGNTNVLQKAEKHQLINSSADYEWGKFYRVRLQFDVLS